MAKAALIGGETAEMPGFYPEDEYDLAGFAVGIVDEADIITGKHPGRENEDEIIVYSIGGMPVEDIAWGGTVYNNAVRQGIGIKLPLWEEPEMA